MGLRNAAEVVDTGVDTPRFVSGTVGVHLPGEPPPVGYGTVSDLIRVLSMIERLPLTDEEKAEAVRRLLKDG